MRWLCLFFCCLAVCHITTATEATNKGKLPTSFVSVSEALHIKGDDISSTPALAEIGQNLQSLSAHIDELSDKIGVDAAQLSRVDTHKHPGHIANHIEALEGKFSSFLRGESDQLPTDLSPLKHSFLESGNENVRKMSKATAFLAGNGNKNSRNNAPRSGYSAPASSNNNKASSPPLFEFHRRPHSKKGNGPAMINNPSSPSKQNNNMNKTPRFMTRLRGQVNSEALVNRIDSYRRQRGHSKLRGSAQAKAATSWVLNRLGAATEHANQQQGANNPAVLEQQGNNGYSAPSAKEPTDPAQGGNTRSMIQVEHAVSSSAKGEPKPGAASIPGGGSPFTVNGNFPFPNVPGSPLIPSYPAYAGAAGLASPVAYPPTMMPAQPLYPTYPAAAPALTMPGSYPYSMSPVASALAANNAMNAATLVAAQQQQQLSLLAQRRAAMFSAQRLQMQQLAIQQQLQQQQLFAQRMAQQAHANAFATHTANVAAAAAGTPLSPLPTNAGYY